MAEDQIEAARKEVSRKVGAVRASHLTQRAGVLASRGDS